MIQRPRSLANPRLRTSLLAGAILAVTSAPVALAAEPCGASGSPGEFYACTNTEPPCIGLASGNYWNAGGTTAYQHACTGVQTQQDGTVCVGEGSTSRTNATTFHDHCEGVTVFVPPSSERVACVGDSSSSGSTAAGMTRSCDRPIPPTLESIAADVALVIAVATGEQAPTALLP